MIRRALIAMLLAVLAAAATPARADELRPGYLELTQQDEESWQLIWKAPVLGGLATHARPLVPRFCTLGPARTRLDGTAVVALIPMRCSRPLAGAPVGLTGMDGAFTDALVRIAPLGKPIQAERLTRARPAITVASVPDTWQVGRTYLALGVDHILRGYDHLLFVIALVLLLMRPMALIKAATAFTVAHSLTLAGTTLGLFGLAQAPVEVLIALSIAFLAVEIAKQDPARPRLSERLPWLVAFVFGLIHGFGFAGALREIGLPGGDVPMALLAFNLGVEAGQLAIIAAVLALAAVIRRAAPLALRPATVACAYAIGTVSSLWLLERLSP